MFYNNQTNILFERFLNTKIITKKKISLNKLLRIFSDYDPFKIFCLPNIKKIFYNIWYLY